MGPRTSVGVDGLKTTARVCALEGSVGFSKLPRGLSPEPCGKTIVGGELVRFDSVVLGSEVVAVRRARGARDLNV